MRDLTLADWQRVAEQRLLPANRTLGTFMPTEKAARAPAPAAVDVAQQMQTFRPQAGMAQAESFDVSPANIDQRTQRLRMGGLQVALLPKTTRGQVVSAVLRLRLGDVQSLKGQAQTGALWAALIDKGGAGLTRQQIQDRLDQWRTELMATYARGVLTVNLQSRREHLPAVLDLLARLLREPAFDQATLSELQRQALSAIEQARQEPGDIVAKAVSRHGNPHGPGDPRAVPSFDEEAQAVRAVTVNGLRQFHARFAGAGTAATPLEAAGMCLLVSTMGFFGGLVMSAIKRDRGIKDWGHLIAGHGGFLDRLDSVIFAAPIFFHVTRWVWSTT